MNILRRILQSLLLAGVLVGVACAPNEESSAEQSPTNNVLLDEERVASSTIDAAIAQGDLAEVQRLLELDPQRANQGQHPKLSPLHQALLRQQREIALALIAAGADVDAADSSQRTPLHLCVDRDLPQVAAALLQAGAKPNEWDKAGWTPLHNAAAKNRLAVTKALIDGGADPQVLSQRGGTPLHEAAASADAALIQYLLDQGLDPSVQAESGDTAFDVAVRSQNTAATKILEGIQ